jgi:carboxylate-amine ligase
VRFLIETNSIVEQTQIWWSVRPHHSFGTVELRICDAQTSAADSTALEALVTACVAQAALDEEEGVPFDDPPGRFIEENFWRAIRYGLSESFIDLSSGQVLPTRKRLEDLIAWVAPVADELGVTSYLAVPERNAAERQIAAYEAGESMEAVYAREVLEPVRV